MRCVCLRVEPGCYRQHSEKLDVRWQHTVELKAQRLISFLVIFTCVIVLYFTTEAVLESVYSLVRTGRSVPSYFLQIAEIVFGNQLRLEENFLNFLLDRADTFILL